MTTTTTALVRTRTSEEGRDEHVCPGGCWTAVHGPPGADGAPKACLVFTLVMLVVMPPGGADGVLTSTANLPRRGKRAGTREREEYQERQWRIRREARAAMMRRQQLAVRRARWLFCRRWISNAITVSEGRGEVLALNGTGRAGRGTCDCWRSFDRKHCCFGLQCFTVWRRLLPLFSVPNTGCV